MEFRHTEIHGWAGALRGMRMPLKSGAKADSVIHEGDNALILIGPNDHDLAMRLIKAGPEHAKFLRMIDVTVDITAPVYFWRQLDQYKIGTTTNSTSLMHRGMKDEITAESFNLPDGYRHPAWDVIIKALNELRDDYNETKDDSYFEEFRSMCPMGYEYLETWHGSYANLRTIYHQRKNHRLSEWRFFCEYFIEKLPYSEFITAES